VLIFILKKKKGIDFHEQNSNCSENCSERTKMTLNKIYLISERLQVNYQAPMRRIEENFPVINFGLTWFEPHQFKFYYCILHQTFCKYAILQLNSSVNHFTVDVCL